MTKIKDIADIYARYLQGDGKDKTQAQILEALRANTGNLFGTVEDVSLATEIINTRFSGNPQAFMEATISFAGNAQNATAAQADFTNQNTAQIVPAQVSTPTPSTTTRPPTAITDLEDKAVMDAYRALAENPTDGARINALQNALVATGHFNPAHSRTGATTQYLGPVTTDAMERFLDGQAEAVRDDAAKIAEQGLTRIGTATDAASNRAANHFLYTTDAYGEKEGRPDSRAVINNEPTNPTRVDAKTKFDSEILPAVNTRMTRPATPPVEVEQVAPVEATPTPAPATPVINTPKPIMILNLADERSFFRGERDADRVYLSGLAEHLGGNYDVRVARTPQELQQMQAEARAQNNGREPFTLNAREDGLGGAARDGVRVTRNGNEIDLVVDANFRGRQGEVGSTQHIAAAASAVNTIAGAGDVAGRLSYKREDLASLIGGAGATVAGNGVVTSGTTAPSPTTPSGQNPNSADPAGQPATSPPYRMLMGQT